MVIALCLALHVSAAMAQGQSSAESPALPYMVDAYDPTRDPTADLARAVRVATERNKRILLQVGGEWCGWCKRLDQYIQDHPAVLDMLVEDFLIVKVNYGRENRNQNFLGQYPRIHGYPHIFVLESDGTFLHSQDTAVLEEGQTYAEEAVLEFLEEWLPSGR
jgi:thioredoxin-related protein